MPLYTSPKLPCNQKSHSYPAKKKSQSYPATRRTCSQTKKHWCIWCFPPCSPPPPHFQSQNNQSDDCGCITEELDGHQCDLDNEHSYPIQDNLLYPDVAQVWLQRQSATLQIMIIIDHFYNTVLFSDLEQTDCTPVTWDSQ